MSDTPTSIARQTALRRRLAVIRQEVDQIVERSAARMLETSRLLAAPVHRPTWSGRRPE